MTEREVLVRIAVSQGWKLCSDPDELKRTFRGHYRLLDEALKVTSVGGEVLISQDGLDVEPVASIERNTDLRYTSDLGLMMSICDFGWSLTSEEEGYTAHDINGTGGHWGRHPAEALALLYLCVHQRRYFLGRKRSKKKLD